MLLVQFLIQISNFCLQSKNLRLKFINPQKLSRHLSIQKLIFLISQISFNFLKLFPQLTPIILQLLNILIALLLCALDINTRNRPLLIAALPIRWLSRRLVWVLARFFQFFDKPMHQLVFLLKHLIHFSYLLLELCVNDFFFLQFLLNAHFLSE